MNLTEAQARTLSEYGYPFRTMFPYCITAVPGGWVFRNRDYSAIGYRHHVPLPEIARLSGKFRFSRWPGNIEGVWWGKQPRVSDCFWLYSDSIESRFDYFARLSRLMGFVRPPAGWQRGVSVPVKDTRRQGVGPDLDFWEWLRVTPPPKIAGPEGGLVRCVMADLLLREPDEHGRRQMKRPDDPAWNARHKLVMDEVYLAYLQWFTSNRPTPRRKPLPREELEALAAIADDLAY